tara:strand:- start:1918 stop:6012 length:4095 start_codon:yes stop_codon:yes gene_type:complete
MESESFNRAATAEIERLQANPRYQQHEKDDEPGIYKVPGVKGFWEGTGTALGGALDILGKPAAILPGTIQAVQEGRPFWEGIGDALWGDKQDLNFATVFEKAGWEHEGSRNVMGFALDVVLDPLNLFAIAKVRSLTGKVIEGVQGPIAAVPIRGKTVGQRMDAFSEPVQRRFAKLFSPRIGLGQGDTYWELRRRHRNNPEQLKIVEEMIEHDRVWKNFSSDKDKLAASEFYEVLHGERKAWALRDQGRMGREAATEAEATRIADDFLATIQTDDDLARAIGNVLHRFRHDLDEVAGMKKPAALRTRKETGEIIDAATGEVHVPRPETESMRYDIGASALETLGREGRVTIGGEVIEMGVAGREGFSINGLGSIAKTVQLLYGAQANTWRAGSKHLPLLQARGRIRELSEQLWGNFHATESFYYPKFMPDMQVLNNLEKSGTKAARVQKSQRALASKSGRDAPVEMDFRVAYIHDIAARRQGFEAQKIISTKMLRGLAPTGRAAPFLFKELREKQVDLQRRYGKLLAGEGNLQTGNEVENVLREWVASAPDATRSIDEQIDEFLNQLGVLPEASMDMRWKTTPRQQRRLDEASEARERLAGLRMQVDRSARDPQGRFVSARVTAADEAALAKGESIEKGLASYHDWAQKVRQDLRDVLESTPRDGEGVFTRGEGHSLLSGTEAGAALDDALKEAGQLVGGTDQSSWILPDVVAGSLNKFNDPYELTGFLRTVDAFNNFWKPTVTVFPLFVSFFTRNAIGLVQNLALSGMGPQAITSGTMRSMGIMRKGMFNEYGRVSGTLNAEGHRKVAARHFNVEPEQVTEQMLRDVKPAYDFSQPELLREAQKHGGMQVGSRDLAPLDVGAPGREGLASEAAASMRGEAVFAGGTRPRAGAGVEEFRGPTGGVRATGRKFWSALTNDDAIRLTPMERTKAVIANYDQGLKERHGFNLFGYGTSFNQYMDNNARLAHIMWRLEHGDTIAEASRSAAKFIGDYTELGRATNELASVIPFFRWTRFNVPLQVEGLLTRPYVGSKLAAVTGDSAEEQQLLSEGATLPDWVLDRHHIVMGKTKEGRIQIIRGLGLPIEDLNKLFARTGEETFRNILSEATPILRMPIERISNQSFFTGEAIEDDDDLYGFYRRGYAWATAPGVSQTLNQWLQIERIENPDTGRISYRSGNPMAMYVWSSFFGRFSQTGDKFIQAVESRDEVGWGMGLNLLTGVKNSEVYPDRPETTGFNEVINASPYLRNLHDQYMQIPLYPQFNDIDMSRTAQRGAASINSFRRTLSMAVGRKVSWHEAAKRWGEISQSHRDEELAARMVKDKKWKQEGRKKRKAFRERYPAYAVALDQNLTDFEKSIALDSDALPS